jgi:membrane fusion protein (multidrug efflux system)
VALLGAALLLGACGGGEDEGSASAAAGGRPGGGGPPGAGQWGDEQPAAAVPVEAATVVRRDISSYIETNGTLEAENEVDIVARVAAPVIELNAEEGMAVRRGQVLARLEDDELRARLEVSRVARHEAQLAFDRAKELRNDQLVSAEAFEQAQTRLETAKAQLDGDEIQLAYTVIEAPFDGLIVSRYVDYAQQVAANTPLFRISDFDPLLCPIQVAERELQLLELGQSAYLEVEAWPGQRFDAKVLRISPVVDSATGTIKVTLEVSALGKLRPGMFARAFLRTASRSETLVIPRTALSLESIGDTVYVAADGAAQRREVVLGFREGESIEILEGVSEGELVVTIGQDGLSDGTPVQVLAIDGAQQETGDDRMAAGGPGGPPADAGGAPRGGESPPESQTASESARPEGSALQNGAPDGATSQATIPEANAREWGGDPGMRSVDLSQASPEQLERIRAMMRSRGLSDEQIEERLKMMRQKQEENGS